MNILEQIKNACYDETIKDNKVYDELCKQSDKLESEITKHADKEVRKLFKEYVDVVDKFALFYTDYALEYSYKKVKEILKELLPNIANII